MNKNLKIAIYAICKNEKQYVNKWFQSMLEADYICVLDTGSTDGTYEKLLEWQEKFPEKIIISQKTYEKWRFDIPRNDSLKLVPEDANIYWCTDLDELLEPGWSIDLKNNWQENQTRGVYLYAWSHTDTGAPGRVFWYDKIHTKDYIWQYPVHEMLKYTGKEKENIEQISQRILLHHYPDPSKNRSNYLGLLELRLQENPIGDEYGKIYLAHEYFLQQKYETCIDFILSIGLLHSAKSLDALFTPDLCLFLGDSYLALKDNFRAEQYYRMGIASCPQFRENYISLALFLLQENRAVDALKILTEMLEKTIRLHSWLERDASWNWLPYHLLAWTYLLLNNPEIAHDFALLAYTLNPTEDLKHKYLAIKEQLDNQQTCRLTKIEQGAN